ncbi:MAG: alpha/beta fold hydrolase [Leptospiraceae bacterium]|nr:alpha/beta fold hydrolase [Leptospiraceae bacterium]
MPHWLVFFILLFSHCATLKLRGERHEVITRDGWKLTLEHFPSSGPGKRFPVLLCHGLLANRNYFKIKEEKSLAYLLAQAGYDVWLMDLRGRADAGSPSYFFGKFRYNYGIDEYIRHDADAAIAYVLEKTKSNKLNWIGHSLGGVVGYSRAGSYEDRRLHTLVTLGSPMRIAPLDRSMQFLFRMQGAMVLLPAIPVSPLFKLGFWGPGFLQKPFERVLIYLPNTDKETKELLVFEVVTNISKNEVYQFIDAVLHEAVVSSDKKINYRQDLRKISIPVLAIAARRDHLADPLTVRDAFELLGSKDKFLFIASKAEGLSEDYGHTDLLVGKKAHEEIFPKIIHFLDKFN